MGPEKGDKFHFLNITIQQREDGTVQHSVFWKDTWDGVYLNLNSFCLISYKTEWSRYVVSIHE